MPDGRQAVSSVRRANRRMGSLRVGDATACIVRRGGIEPRTPNGGIIGQFTDKSEPAEPEIRRVRSSGRRRDEARAEFVGLALQFGVERHPAGDLLVDRLQPAAGGVGVVHLDTSAGEVEQGL